MKLGRIAVGVACVTGLTLLIGLPAWTQDPELKNVSNEQLKKMLDGLGVKYVEASDGGFSIRVAKPGETRREYRCFIYSHLKGQALVISSSGYLRNNDFAKLKTVPGDNGDELLEQINHWNQEKALSRAIMDKGTDYKGKKIYYARLEADLDCGSGVTAKKVDGFIKQFAGSLGQFDAFLGAAPVKPGVEPTPGELSGKEVVHFPLNSKGESAQGDSVQASWRVHYAVDRKNGLCIVGAWFKKKGDSDWLKVIEDVRVSSLYIPYEDGSPRYFDMDIGTVPYLQHGHWSLGQLAVAEENMLGPSGKKLNDFVVRENRDAGLLWVYNDKLLEMKPSTKDRSRRYGSTFAHRRQEMQLWSIFQATNYFYIMQYGFHNDGTITCRLGSTGKNLHNHAAKGTGHMHNTGWRVHLDLGGSGPDAARKLAERIEVHQVRHLERPEDIGKASTVEGPTIANEAPFDWSPEQFTSLRVRNPHKLNELQLHPISYDLVPLRNGSARHFAPPRKFDADNHKDPKLDRPNDDFTHHDFWVTNSDPLYTNYEQLPKYAKDRKKLAGNPVLWHLSSSLHIPRDEDFVGAAFGHGAMSARATGATVIMWSGFDMRPRNLFGSTPFLKR